MDLEVIEMFCDNNISIVVKDINDFECLLDVYNDTDKGTKVGLLINKGEINNEL